jgi:WXXGXW repeat (2 copies)
MSAHLQNRTPVPGRALALPIGARQLWLIALGLLTAVVLFASQAANADVAISVNIAPPALPVYEQPVIPGPGYVWVPGYWAYGPEGYYWVPGTWVEPPEAGLLWTPGYWGWSNGAYLWSAGYWGPVVGFYGGVNYGYGYPGNGYEGGYWRNNQFYYNRTVNNISNTNITNVYSKTVNTTTVNNISYNGGPGGTTARPTAQEQAAARQRREGPTSAQTQHVAAAGRQHDLLASVNHGIPPIAATPKPGSFSGPGVVHARGAGAPAQQQGKASGNPTEQRQAGQRQAQQQAEQRQTEQRQAQQRQADTQRQAQQTRHLAEAPRNAPPQERERAAPARPATPAERMAPPREAPQQREQPRAEHPHEQRKPEEPRP